MEIQVYYWINNGKMLTEIYFLKLWIRFNISSNSACSMHEGIIIYDYGTCDST